MGSSREMSREINGRGAREHDVPEDVPKLICNDDCPTGTRKKDLSRFFWNLSTRVSQS